MGGETLTLSAAVTSFKRTPSESPENISRTGSLESGIRSSLYFSPNLLTSVTPWILSLF